MNVDVNEFVKRAFKVLFLKDFCILNKFLMVSEFILADCEGVLLNVILPLSKMAKSVLDMPKSIATFILSSYEM